jgi:branched-subunit amino acid aminotransferase/4-amino-4-deoxychorismate lyase
VTLLALAVSGRGLVDPDTPVVHVDDEGFLRGRGAFETVRVYGGRPFRLDRHLARLAESSRRLGIPEPDTAELESLVAAALEHAGEPDAVLRLYRTPGREGAGKPVAFALVASLPGDLDAQRARGLRLVTVELGIAPPWPLAGVKSTSYALNMIAVDTARSSGGDDALLLARGRIVLEGPTSNVWWRRDRTLFTPSLELGILAGVTRGVLLEAADGLGYEIREGAFALDELLGADEAFMSSSIREVVPVVAVDEAPVGTGPAAAELQDALRAVATGT